MITYYDSVITEKAKDVAFVIFCPGIYLDDKRKNIEN
jgi:hypothetical protein